MAHEVKSTHFLSAYRIRPNFLSCSSHRLRCRYGFRRELPLKQLPIGNGLHLTSRSGRIFVQESCSNPANSCLGTNENRELYQPPPHPQPTLHPHFPPVPT